MLSLVVWRNIFSFTPRCESKLFLNIRIMHCQNRGSGFNFMYVHTAQITVVTDGSIALRTCQIQYEQNLPHGHWRDIQDSFNLYESTSIQTYMNVSEDWQFRLVITWKLWPFWPKDIARWLGRVSRKDNTSTYLITDVPSRYKVVDRSSSLEVQSESNHMGYSMFRTLDFWCQKSMRALNWSDY